jgi:hypothetical protein
MPSGNFHNWRRQFNTVQVHPGETIEDNRRVRAKNEGRDTLNIYQVFDAQVDEGNILFLFLLRPMVIVHNHRRLVTLLGVIATFRFWLEARRRGWRISA